VRSGFAVCQNSPLIGLRESNVAVTRAVDMHEHFPPDEKRVFMDSCIWPLRYTGQVQNSLP
jgi:hypothetical protein